MAKFFELPKTFLALLGFEPLLPKIPRRRYTTAATFITLFENAGIMRAAPSLGIHILCKWLQYNSESFVLTWDAGTDTMIVVRRSSLVEAINEFDVASHQNGYLKNEGNAADAEDAKSTYDFARRKVLRNLGISP